MTSVINKKTSYILRIIVVLLSKPGVKQYVYIKKNRGPILKVGIYYYTEIGGKIGQNREIIIVGESKNLGSYTRRGGPHVIHAKRLQTRRDRL